MAQNPRRLAGCVFVCVCLFLPARHAAAQDALEPAAPSQAEQQHEHQHMNMGKAGGWQFMQEGVIFGVFNHQGGLRGADEFKAPNWWMGMASRTVGASQLTLNGMFSLDPATAGKD